MHHQHDPTTTTTTSATATTTPLSNLLPVPHAHFTPTPSTSTATPTSPPTPATTSNVTTATTATTATSMPLGARLGVVLHRYAWLLVAYVTYSFLRRHTNPLASEEVYTHICTHIYAHIYVYISCILFNCLIVYIIIYVYTYICIYMQVFVCTAALALTVRVVANAAIRLFRPSSTNTSTSTSNKTSTNASTIVTAARSRTRSGSDDFGAINNISIAPGNIASLSPMQCKQRSERYTAVPARLHSVALPSLENSDIEGESVRLVLLRGLRIVASFQLQMEGRHHSTTNSINSVETKWDPLTDTNISTNTSTSGNVFSTSTVSNSSTIAKNIDSVEVAHCCVNASVHFRCTTIQAAHSVSQACNRLCIDNEANESAFAWKFPGIFCILQRVTSREAGYSVSVHVRCGLYVNESDLLRDVQYKAEVMCFIPLSMGYASMLTHSAFCNKSDRLLHANVVKAVLNHVSSSHVLHVIWDVFIDRGADNVNSITPLPPPLLVLARASSVGYASLVMNVSPPDLAARSSLLLSHRLMHNSSGWSVLNASSSSSSSSSYSSNNSIGGIAYANSRDGGGLNEVACIAMKVIDMFRPVFESVLLIRMDPAMIVDLASQFSVCITEEDSSTSTSTTGGALIYTVRFPVPLLLMQQYGQIESDNIHIIDHSHAYNGFLPCIHAMEVQQSVATKSVPSRGATVSDTTYTDGGGGTNTSTTNDNTRGVTGCNSSKFVYNLYCNVAWCVGCIYLGRCEKE